MNVRKLSHVLGILLLIGLVAPFVVYAAPQLVGADYGFVVLSGSMQPTMGPGDAVVVKDVPASAVEEGDIITFRRAGSDTPTTHRVQRVVELENGIAFKTKGDANEEADLNLVRPANLAGKVTFIIPFIGYAILFANSRSGFLLLVLGPIALFVVSELWAFLGLSIGSDGDDVGGDEADDGDETPDVVKAAGDGDAPADADVTASAAATATAAAASTDDDGDDGSSIIITRSSVVFLLVLFALYAPYSGYVAFRMRELWSFVVAAASAICLVFVLGLYLTLGSDSAGPKPAQSPDAPAAESLVTRGTVPQPTDDSWETVDSLESLVARAAATDDHVVFDDDVGAYALTNGGGGYRYEAPDDVADDVPAFGATGADDAETPAESTVPTADAPDPDSSTEAVDEAPPDRAVDSTDADSRSESAEGAS